MHHCECVESSCTKTTPILNALANISTHPFITSVPNSLQSPSTNGLFPFSSFPFFFFFFLFLFSMSFFSSSPPPPLPPQTTATAATYITNLGFGYSIAIALGFLFLLSTIILSSYLCCRTLRNNNNNYNRNNGGVVLPRVIFVAEDDHEAGPNDTNIVLGLDQSVINSYPKFQHNNKDGNKNVFGGNYDGVCSICLCEYKDSEILRMMPECRHCFHACCLDAWLKLNGSCPVCRNSPMPTPLQEVVPLAHYAADHRRPRNLI